MLDKCGALYVDTGESRGLVPDDHPSVVSAVRAEVMRDADLVLTRGVASIFNLPMDHRPFSRRPREICLFAKLHPTLFEQGGRRRAPLREGEWVRRARRRDAIVTFKLLS